MKLTKKKTGEILDLLLRAYPDAQCALEHRDPYQLLVAVTLSAQTTDVSVNQVTPALFRKYPDAFAMAKADEDDVAELIRTIGLYRTKSRRLVEQARMLVERFDSEVPADDRLLMSLPGVGQKTANVVMAEAFGAQRIAVDTHVFRVSNRIGLASGKDVFETEEQLKKILPEGRWTQAHHLLIFHGRRCCGARRPNCAECPVRTYCRSCKDDVFQG